MAAYKGRQFLSVSSADRVPRQDGPSKTSTKLSRHPGYSLFEWKKLCESSTEVTSYQKVNLDDLSKHNTEKDCWTAVRGKVYDVTRFLKYHPGRKAQLMRGAGVDCTEIYDKVHPWVNEEAVLKHCLVGYLVPGDRGPKFHELVVTSIESVTHDTKLLTLANPVDSDLTVPPGQHIKIRASIKGELVEREYTPVVHFGESSHDNLMLMIKIYPQGKMTQHIDNIGVGGLLSVHGPVGYFSASAVCSSRTLILIAAGSGLTPMIRLLNLRYKCGSGEDRECSTLLLFANKCEEDILWRKQLDDLCLSSVQFKVVHILSSPNENWKGETGRISYSFLQRHLPSPLTSKVHDIKICICGPRLFARDVSNVLFKLEYHDEDIYCFD